jgi:hypothetical protein
MVIPYNQIGRIFALVVFTLLSLTLIFPSLAEYSFCPFIRLGDKITAKSAFDVTPFAENLGPAWIQMLPNTGQYGAQFATTCKHSDNAATTGRLEFVQNNSRSLC